jgi:hypothetical protein
MESNRISISFVGVYESPIPFIPQLDNKFCRDLFGRPYETTNGLTPEGYAISLANRPYPLVLINPAKIIFKASNDTDLEEYVNAFSSYISKNPDKLPIKKFSAFGINYELEYLKLGKRADLWMWQHFVRADIKTPNEFHALNHLKFTLGVNEREALNFEIEPRAGVEDGIFVSCNHHHQIPMDGLPQKEELQSIIQKSQECLDEVLNKNILEDE